MSVRRRLRLSKRVGSLITVAPGQIVLTQENATIIGDGAIFFRTESPGRSTTPSATGLRVSCAPRTASRRASSPRSSATSTSIITLGHYGSELKLNTTQRENLRAQKIAAVQFDAYERGAIRPKLPDFRDPAEAARAWAEQYEQWQVAEKKLIEAQPKLQAWQDVCDATGTISSDVIPKSVGYRGARQLHQCLHEAGLIYPVRNKNRAIVDWRPYAEHAPKGYMRAITLSINGWVITKTQWTPEGAAFIRANFAA
jgi:phage antirepressor YoqD-like protein